MSAVEHKPIACPQCSKKYSWKPELAGKKVKCKKCGKHFRFPKGGDKSRPSSQDQQPAIKRATDASDHSKPQVFLRNGRANPYDIDEDDGRGNKDAAVGECPLCGAAMPKGVNLCPKCGYNLQTKQREGVPRDGKANAGRRWLTMLVTLLLLAAAGGGYYYFVM